MSRAALFAALIWIAAACGKKEDPPPPASAPTAPAETGGASGSNAPVAPRMASRSAIPRLALVEITAAEAAPLVPALAGAKPLGELLVQAAGRQARQSFCLAGELTPTGAAVQQAMTAKGFVARDPQPRGQPDRPRVTVSGQKEDWRLSANIVPSPNPACSGKIEVVFTFHRVSRRDAPGAAATAPAPAAAAPAAPVSPPPK